MQIYIVKSGQQTGPFSVQQIETMIASGMVSLTDPAWHSGLPKWLALHQVLNISSPEAQPSQPSPVPSAQRTSAAVSPTASHTGALFLYIPTGRLIAMSIATLGIYDAYWVYKNWRFFKERDGLNIRPFWRGIFTYFFIASLLKSIKTDAAANKILPARFSPSGLATGWLVLSIIGNMLGRSPEPAVNYLGMIIAAPAFCFLLPVQNYINALNEALPERPAYSAWSTGHIVCLVVGIILWLLILAGMVNENV